MNKKTFLLAAAVVLLVAAACLYTLIPHKSETPLIGRWETNQSILGYPPLSEAPDEVTVSFAYDTQGSERRTVYSDTTQADFKDAPFHYQVEGDQLTVWQGTTIETYSFTITNDEDAAVMTLTKDDGSVIKLTQSSKHP